MLRRRHDGALELRANGVFVMDTLETSSERTLAAAGVAAASDPRRVLVAGLGLGYTLRAVLEHAGVHRVDVVELEPELVGWLRSGLVPDTVDALDDPRVNVQVRDIADVVAGADRGAYDVLLLDVDNGPDHLVHATNAGLYRRPFLRDCARSLAAGGVLVVWSMADSPALREAMGEVFDEVEVRPCPVRLCGRSESYVLLLGRRAEPVRALVRSEP